MKLTLAPDVRDVWDRSWVTPWVWPAIVAYNFGLGSVFIGGGWARINGPSFSAIRQIGPYLTGATFITVSVAILGAAFVSRHVLACCTWAAAVLHLGLAAAFLTAYITEPMPPPLNLFDGIPDMPPPVRVLLTAIPSYLFIATVHAANAALYGHRGPAPVTPTDTRSAPAARSAGEAGESG